MGTCDVMCCAVPCCAVPCCAVLWGVVRQLGCEVGYGCTECDVIGWGWATRPRNKRGGKQCGKGKPTGQHGLLAQVLCWPYAELGLHWWRQHYSGSALPYVVQGKGRFFFVFNVLHIYCAAAGNGGSSLYLLFSIFDCTLIIPYKQQRDQVKAIHWIISGPHSTSSV